jgi:eukaryotic-like serine/threonine-protein kinase
MSEEGGAGTAAQLVGKTVGGGRFQLRSLLGEGGMAAVYLAYDSVLDRQVAVKTLHSELGREASFRERFRREAQSVAKLTHTNIVSVFDSGEDRIGGATVPFIVMELVEGRPLRGVLDQDIAESGAMPTRKALTITADVLAALDVSHEMNLVHRDIKPGNVMMTRRGVVKVMDFGIARAMQSGVTSMTQTGMVVGTPQYLSPEQALGRGVDARSDLYSVGIMLFELLTGRLPFEADSPLAIAYAHVQEEPVAPSSINRSVPAPVDALVARALRKNPDERFASAEEMREECLRLAAAGTAAAPVIVAGGPSAASGVGVGQAVFPPVSDTGTPPPANVPQQPYQPGFGSYAPSTPPPGPMAPQQAGYGTPPPYAAAGTQTPPPAYGTPAPYAGAQTPPPYAGPAAAHPYASGAAKGGSNTAVIVGSAVAALVVVIAVIMAIAVS